MKDKRDPGTLGLLGPAKRGRGRPRKPDALSNAERQYRYRQRKKAVQPVAVGSHEAAVALLAMTYRDLGQLESAAAAIEARFGVQAEVARLVDAVRTVKRHFS